MRPQHITAENVVACRSGRAAGAGASMRPQHITAENADGRIGVFFGLAGLQ